MENGVSCTDEGGLEVVVGGVEESAGGDEGVESEGGGLAVAAEILGWSLLVGEEGKGPG